MGTTQSVEGDAARVKLESGLAERVRDRLGWTSDEDENELQHSNVDEIADDEVRLKD